MNERPEHTISRSWSKAGPIALILIVIALAFALLVGIPFSSSPAPSAPVPRGEVEIRVDFKRLSTADYNKVRELVKELAEERSAVLEGSDGVKALGDSESFHGFWNDGFVMQRYRPDHPVPSPEVEKAMQERFEEFLEENDINDRGKSLELRYGP